MKYTNRDDQRKVMNKLELVHKLENYFNKREDVVMAFLFGSHAKGRVHKESDVDIAVYIKSKARVEIEAENQYKSESEIWSNVEKIVGGEVDLLILNRASSSVCDVVVRTGIPIIVKDRRLYICYLLAISDLAEEFRNYVFDFRRIKNAHRVG